MSYVVSSKPWEYNSDVFYVYTLKVNKTIHYLIECVVHDEINLIVKQQVPKFRVAITSKEKR